MNDRHKSGTPKGPGKSLPSLLRLQLLVARDARCSRRATRRAQRSPPTRRPNTLRYCALRIVTVAATSLLDIRPHIGYIRRISLIEGRFLGASYKAERVRRLRADLQPAPGRLRASFTPVLRPVREMQSLDWDRKGRVTPAWTASQEAWPGAEPRGQSLGESRSGAPEGERAPNWRASTPRAHSGGDI